MKRFLGPLDELAATNSEGGIARWLDRIIFVFLVLLAISAPNSIAATQSAWLLGMLAWAVRMFFKPRPGFHLTTVHILLLAFFGWTVVSSVFSYAPDISLDKLRGVSLFLIFFFVFANLRTRQAVYFITFALILSCTVNALIMPIQRILGRGIEIHGVSNDSPLKKAGLTEGDAILEANRKRLGSPADLVAALRENETVAVRVYRIEYYFMADLKRADLLPGPNDLASLGIAGWNRNRDWRSAGFYSHYTTYAEVLQLIGSLVFGLLVAVFVSRRGVGEKRRRGEEEKSGRFTPPLLFSPTSLLLYSLAAILLALLLTVTRAPQLAFLISAFVIVLLGAGRKWVFMLAAIALPAALLGLYVLQQSRQVGFFDPNDESTKFRQTVYREGFGLWTANTRHFILGVGMDSVKRYAKEWGLYDNGRYPMTHFHSTPLQLVVERGLPALLLWLAVLGAYARAMWRGISRVRESRSRAVEETLTYGGSPSPLSSPTPSLPFSSTAMNTGIMLGCFGGAIGFFVSSLVHYNLGDGEVAMVFYLLMGLGVKVTELAAASGAQYDSASS